MLLTRIAEFISELGGDIKTLLTRTAPPSMVILNAGATEWTNSENYRWAIVEGEGASGSGASGPTSTSSPGGPGCVGGYFRFVAELSPGGSYPVTIGVGGAAVSGSELNGNSGTATSITIAGETHTANGGVGGRKSTPYTLPNFSAVTTSGLGILGARASNIAAPQAAGHSPGIPGRLTTGSGYGVRSDALPSGPGSDGRIVLTLFK